MAKQETETKKTIAILGAGIVGVSTAIWLQRAGHKVVVIDKTGPAAGTSYGNAGILASGAIVPVPTPGILRKAPGMLFDSNQPLFLRWSYLPKLLPFLSKYLSYSDEKSVNRIADGLADLLLDSADQHVALAKGTGAEKYIHEGDYLFGYKDKAAYLADAFAWEIKIRKGVKIEEMDAARFAEYDPAMKGRFGYGVRCLHHGHISDPGEYVKALASHAEDQGCTSITSEVTDIVIENNRAKTVVTKDGPVEADEIVFATGIWSGALSKKLGITVPMEAERGYHIEFVNPSIMPKSPVMVATGKFVITPMQGRLRCAGIVEFGGLTEDRSQPPFDLLKRQTMELLPELTYDRIDEWMGFRPSTADSLPLIGAFKNVPNVWSAFGHQHIGLTGGPKTGRWVSQLISGQKPNVDLAPFGPDRFE